MRRGGEWRGGGDVEGEQGWWEEAADRSLHKCVTHTHLHSHKRTSEHANAGLTVVMASRQPVYICLSPDHKLPGRLAGWPDAEQADELLH